MNILYAFLITLVVYPVFGTLLFAFVESLRISVKFKVFVVTFVHPLLSAAFIWLICSPFNQEMANAGLLLVAGSFLRLPFSDRKYLISLSKNSETTTIEYLSEMLKHKTIKIITSDIGDLSQSPGKNLIDKPSALTMTTPDQTLTFMILDKKIHL